MTGASVKVRDGARLRGACSVPGDKSISHRGVMLGGLATGTSHLRGFLMGHDCMATIACLQALGCVVEQPGTTEVVVVGRGLHGLAVPSAVLHCGNSGTTMRLLAGLLSGHNIPCRLTGTPQLLRRPMGRVVEPLRQMGARISGCNGNGYAPLALEGQERPLSGLHYRPPVPSAQVKSAVLLAGLYASGEVTLEEPIPTRDHTEQMLRQMGAPISRQGRVVHLRSTSTLRPLAMTIPGDLSSAAFILAAAAMCGDEVLIRGVGVNPTRSGILTTLLAMGAEVEFVHRTQEGDEPVADLRVRARPLHGVVCEGEVVATMLDELPVLAVLATQANGRTLVRDASELRVKETDRIATTVEELRKLGARIESTADGFVVEGPVGLRGAPVHSHGDHRLAMALVVAGLIAEGETVVDGAAVIADSFPGFCSLLRSLGADLSEELSSVQPASALYS